MTSRASCAQCFKRSIKQVQVFAHDDRELGQNPPLQHFSTMEEVWTPTTDLALRMTVGVPYSNAAVQAHINIEDGP